MSKGGRRPSSTRDLHFMECAENPAKKQCKYCNWKIKDLPGRFDEHMERKHPEIWESTKDEDLPEGRQKKTRKCMDRAWTEEDQAKAERMLTLFQVKALSLKPSPTSLHFR